VPRVRLPKLPPGRERRLEEGEEDAILGELYENKPMVSIIQFALETAMRRSEICRLEWSDVAR
jgi:integrase